jgi:hypothetical protein
MRTWLKHLLLLAVLSLATWAAVIAAWYAQRRVVSLDDALQYLLALPLLLFAGVLIVRGMPSATPAGRSAAVSNPAPAPAADPAYPLLGAWAHTPAGADLSALLAALAEGRPRPTPDAQLRDLDGLPVLSARIAALDPAAGQAALPPEVRLSPAALRALAALSPLLDQAEDALTDTAGEAAQAPAADLHVLACWPATWSTDHAQAAQAWLAQRLQPLAGTLAPACATGAELLLQAQAHLDGLHRTGRAGRVLALACHSDLDDEAVQRLERLGRLYAMPRCPRGLMPGEAAAALLLSTPPRPAADGATAPAAETAAPVLLRALRAQPSSPATASARRAAVASALLDAALRVTDVEPGAVAALCADVDQHGDACTALHALAQGTLPHLDPLEDLRLTGLCCGHTGAVAPLLALAAAWSQCAQGEKPVAAVSLTEDAWQMVAVLEPDTGQAA